MLVASGGIGPRPITSVAGWRRHRMTQPPPGDFKVLLQSLHDAIGTVTREKSTISTELAAIDRNTTDLVADWNSPAEETFDVITKWFGQASRDLTDALDDIIKRLQTTCNNYAQAETHNYQNVDKALVGPQPLTAGTAQNGPMRYKLAPGPEHGNRTPLKPVTSDQHKVVFYKSVHPYAQGMRVTSNAVLYKLLPGPYAQGTPVTSNVVFYKSVHGPYAPMTVPPGKHFYMSVPGPPQPMTVPPAGA
ncbi:WXG100 family type VII secretion target [Actinoallomurus sp. CA-150999]|uniref:WXG100 family type VII secretion target n=1 Tax=Actinoallomurus sp. CA-150999 TaxID=3239887 RepID=UPI003D8ECFC7